MLCLVVAAVGFSAVAPATVPAAGATQIPVEIIYKGTYEYHEKAENGGLVVSYVNQDVTWCWRASGSVPLVPVSSGSKTKLYGVKDLRGHLSVSGISSDTGNSAPAQTCHYKAGALSASSPIEVSLRENHGALEAGYGVGIPEVAASCDGGAYSGPSDVLNCDLDLCEAGICAAAPPAITSAAKDRPPIETAFKPTTDYTKTGYVSLNKLGWSDVKYDLPAKLGSVSTTCNRLNNYYDESERISISSSVYVSRLG